MNPVPAHMFGRLAKDEAHAWSGQWIQPVEPVQGGEWACFRTTIDLARPVLAPRLLVACESKYWLWIDGQMQVFEGQLKRGPTPVDSYYDDVNLACSLAAGRHTLAILVWYWGKPGFSHNASGAPGLVAELLDADQKLIVTDSNWRSIRHPAYSAGDGPAPNYRLPEPNVCFDARCDIPGWNLTSFDDSAWPTSRAMGVPPVAPWGNLIRRPIPMWRDLGACDYVSARATPFVSDGSPIVCRLPYNLHATPILDIEAPADLMIDIRTDNYSGGGANNVRGTYTTRAGRQNYESLGWMNGHEMIYHIPAGVVVHDLKYRATEYDTPWLGLFDCDQPRVNLLLEKSCRTLNVCMRDNYMDCPDRERAQWWGDVVIQSGSAFYACDAIESTKLVAKGIRELMNWQRRDDTLFSPIPAGVPRPGHTELDLQNGCWDKELPAQMLASVGHYGFWNYYLYSGDLDLIRDVYPMVQRFLDLWKFDEATGLVEHRRGGWDWIDWGANVDSPVSSNAWYALAVRGMMNMAQALGREADVVRSRFVLKRMYEGFNAAFWTGTHYQGDASLTQPDDRAQAMAVVGGFVDRHKAPHVIDVLETQRHAGPYMEKYIVEALFQLDRPDLAMARMMDRFAAQIDSPITTLWEGWSVRDATWGGGTYNHAWSGWAITLMQQYVAGVRPLSPGFERVSIQPRPGPLQRIKSRVPTRFGIIQLQLDTQPVKQADTRGEFLTVVIPSGVRAEISTPASGKVQLSGGTHRLPWRSAAAKPSEPLA